MKFKKFYEIVEEIRFRLKYTEKMILLKYLKI